jgi:hypothetical protein
MLDELCMSKSRQLELERVICVYAPVERFNLHFRESLRESCIPWIPSRIGRKVVSSGFLDRKYQHLS